MLYQLKFKLFNSWNWGKWSKTHFRLQLPTMFAINQRQRRVSERGERRNWIYGKYLQPLINYNFCNCKIACFLLLLNEKRARATNHPRIIFKMFQRMKTFTFRNRPSSSSWMISNYDFFFILLPSTFQVKVHKIDSWFRLTHNFKIPNEWNQASI